MCNIDPTSIYRWRTLARLGKFYLIRSLSSLSNSSIFPLLFGLGLVDVFRKLALDSSSLILSSHKEIFLFCTLSRSLSLSLSPSVVELRVLCIRVSGPSACLLFSLLHEVLCLAISGPSCWILRSALLPGAYLLRISSYVLVFTY